MEPRSTTGGPLETNQHLQKFAATSAEQITDATVIRITLDNLEESGVFHHDIRDWRKRPTQLSTPCPTSRPTSMQPTLSAFASVAVSPPATPNLPTLPISPTTPQPNSTLPNHHLPASTLPNIAGATASLLSPTKTPTTAKRAASASPAIVKRPRYST
jgi:hypothetical protein